MHLFVVEVESQARRFVNLDLQRVQRNYIVTIRFKVSLIAPINMIYQG